MILKNVRFQLFFSHPMTVFAILAGLGCAAYANALHHPFVHDDIPLVLENPLLQNWNWKEVFFQKTYLGSASDLSQPYYRPMLNVIHRCVYLVFGLNPFAFHAFNVALHVINGWLVFLIMKKVLRNFQTEDAKIPLAALAVAVLFVIHPVQTQAVACVSGISNLAFVFFCLAAFWLYLVFSELSGSRRQKFIGMMSVMFILAVLCKEQALVFPGLVIGYEGCLAMARRELVSRWLSIFRISLIFLSLIAGYIAWKNVIGVQTFMIDPTAGGWMRILAIPHILWENLRILLLPYDLHYFRSLDFLANHFWPTLMLGALLISLVYCLKFFQANQRGLILFGLGWFIVAQIPTIQIIPLLWEYSYMSTAEHFLYWPSIGLFMAAVVALQSILRRVARMTKIVISIGIVGVFVLFLTTTIHQNDFWKSNTAVFERAIAYEPQLGRLQHILAQVYFYEQRYPEAVSADQSAIRIMTQYESVAVGEESKAYYRMIRVDSMMSLGLSYWMMGDFSMALDWIKKSIELDPDNADYQSTLGVLYAEQGNLQGAEGYLAKAVELSPDNAEYLHNYGLLLSIQGRVEEARKCFTRALELNPSDEAAQDFLKGSLKHDSIF